MKSVKLKWLVSASNAGEVIDKSHWGDGDESLYTCARDVLRSDFNAFPRWKRTTGADLLLTRNGTPYIHIPLEGAIYSNVVQRISVPKVDKRYLRYALEDRVRSFRGYGVSIESLNYEMWSNLQVPLHDLATQRQIADFLDRETARIDLLIEKKQRLVALLGARFNAGRNDAFRQVPSSQYRPLRWLITQICDGPFGSGLTSVHYTEAGVRVIRLQNIKDGGLDNSNAAYIPQDHYATLGDHDVNTGDLLVAGLGDERNKVGRACVAPDDLGAAMVKADCYRVRLNARLVSHHFAAEYLCSDESWPQIDALAKGVTRSRLNLELVRRIRIPAPSLAEQNEIIDQIDRERRIFSTVSERVCNSIDRLKEYRSALITAAVTGQIDVGTYAKADTPDRQLEAIQEEMGA